MTNITNFLELNQINSLSVGSIFKLTIVILLVLFHIYLCLIDRPLLSKDYQNKNFYLEENSSNLQISNSPANYNTSQGQVIDKNSSNLIEDKKEKFFFSTLYTHITELSLEGQMALCFLILKSFILSSIISILFIFYGDMLIEKYQLKDKYPSLAKVIELRVKFRRYYLIYNVLFIIVTILVEITFCIAVLMLEF